MKNSFLLGGRRIVIKKTPKAFSQTFGTSLSGAAEAPPVAVDGSGVATVTIKGTSVTFSIFVKGISTPTLAHIHKAVAGVSGAVVIDFLKPTFTNGFASGTVTGAADVVADLLANPSSYYVNVHTAENPSGALRGQLGPTVPTQTFTTTLIGAGEAPGAGTAEGGGVAQVTISGTTVNYTIMIQGLASTPTAGHIHRGIAGVAGPVVIPFPLAFTNGVTSGTVTAAPALISEILSNPTGFYVNVHTAEFPGGAARGQLNPAAPATIFIPTVVKASGVNGANYVSDLRVVNTTSVPANITLDYFAASDGVSTPSATATMPMAAGAHAVVNDVLGTLFSTSGTGALRVTSDRPVIVTSRVLNDQRASGAGTTGLPVPGAATSDLPTNGTIPFLSNASAADIAAGKGFRTNIGYFNPTSATVKATFKARRNDGTVIGSNDVTIAGYARVQKPVFDLISSTAEADRTAADFYVTYSADGPLVVYAAVADDKTGDGIYFAGANPR